MVSFYLTFIAVLLAGLGARDQVLVAGLTRAQGARMAVLVVALLACAATAAFAGWAAATVAPLLAPKARVFFAAMALVFAGLESLLLTPGRPPREPTLSLGALLLALLALQAIDAARFLIFAIGVATNAPMPPAIGGAVAGGALLFGAWFAPDLALKSWMRAIRRSIGAVLVLVGVILGARTIIFV